MTRLTRRALMGLFGSAAAVGSAGCDLPLWTRKEVLPVESWHKSVCRFCGSGCETMVGLNKGRVVTVEGHQAGWNRGRLCM